MLFWKKFKIRKGNRKKRMVEKVKKARKAKDKQYVYEECEYGWD